MNSGCVWCSYRPSWDDFKLEHIDTVNQIEKLSKLMTQSQKLCVPFDTVNSSNILNSTSNNKILINMIGITGSGKSTSSSIINDLIISKGGSCLIVSADKWSKKGYKGKQLQNAINKEIRDFDNTQSTLKVIIVDICNENGPSSNCFGFNTSSYTSLNFYPNLDKNKFHEYQCWCLRNVLSRPESSPSTLFWLNPVSAGVSTCIKVHNMKSIGLKKLLGIVQGAFLSENLSLNEILTQIKTHADNYDTFLNTKNLNETINDFLKSHKLI